MATKKKPRPKRPPRPYSFTEIPAGEEAPPPGTIGVVSGDLARYSEFSVDMLRLIRPTGSYVHWVKGLDVTSNYNKMIEGIADDSQWFWIMGDDHTFDPLILIQLLSRNVDVVVPLCLQRHAPFRPVVYAGEVPGTEETGGFPAFFPAKLPPPGSGLFEVHAAGTAGMLIRRHVLEKLEKPIFQTSGVHQNEDLNLCEKIRNAGFKIHCDVDARLGHIGNFGIFPMWIDEMQQYGTVLMSGDQYIPLFPDDPQEPSDEFFDEAA